MRVFVDACVLARLTLNPSKPTGVIAMSALASKDIVLVTSSYAMREALRTVADVSWPPKAALAFVQNVGLMLTMQRLEVMLEDVALPDETSDPPVCDDPADLPIIMAAELTACDVLLTEDKKVLASRCKVRCIRASELSAELEDSLAEFRQQLASAEENSDGPSL